MKTLNQFEEMEPEFIAAIKDYKGELGDDFYRTIELFMHKYDFEDPVAIFLYEDADGTFIFFSDHPENDAGFVFMELHDIISGTRVMTRIYAGSKLKTMKKLQMWWEEYENAVGGI